MSVEIQNGNLVLTIPLQKAEMSSTRKSLVVASTGGFTTTGQKVDGKPLKVNFCAIIPVAK